MADEVKHGQENCQLPHSKRKPDFCLVEANDDEGHLKKFKTETETTNIVDGEKEQPPAFELPDEADADDDEEEEHSSGEADREGKSIVSRDDKGKGKLVEEDDDSSDDEIHGGGEGVLDEEDDDSSEDEDDEDSGDEDDSDLSDDPLTEVDLDNILPSRTRRRSAASNPGICLGKGNDN